MSRLHRVLLETVDRGERARAHLELAILALRQGRREAAVRHLREALALDTRLERARALLAELGETSRVLQPPARRRGRLGRVLRRFARRDEG